MLRDTIARPYQWVVLMRKDVKEPWKLFQDLPLYQIAVSPSKDSRAVSFNNLDYEYWTQWNKDVDAGKTVLVNFPDSSKLYLNAELTKEDQTYLSKAFWDQRWERWGAMSLPFLGAIFLPPLALLLLGAFLVWVGRGFAHD
jgi:hypothetical protein